MSKEKYTIFPGQIKINNCTYFGLDYELTDFVNHLAEQNQKYKEVIEKAIEYLTSYSSIHTIQFGTENDILNDRENRVKKLKDYIKNIWNIDIYDFDEDDYYD